MYSSSCQALKDDAASLFSPLSDLNPEWAKAVCLSGVKRKSGRSVICGKPGLALHYLQLD